jgi:hypothetical protein
MKDPHRALRNTEQALSLLKDGHSPEAVAKATGWRVADVAAVGKRHGWPDLDAVAKAWADAFARLASTSATATLVALPPDPAAHLLEAAAQAIPGISSSLAGIDAHLKTLVELATKQMLEDRSRGQAADRVRRLETLISETEEQTANLKAALAGLDGPRADGRRSPY